MLSVEDGVLVLLAAGRSSRFGGDGGKLRQEFLGRPLGMHVATALAEVPFRARLAVTAGPPLPFGDCGFEVVDNPDRDLGMATSIRAGVARAAALGARSVLVALADMPRVTAAHVRRLFDASTDEATVVASSDGADAKPPALFGAGRFAELLALDGDAGARGLIVGGRHVVAPSAELFDVDTPEDLEALRATVHDPARRTR